MMFYAFFRPWTYILVGYKIPIKWISIDFEVIKFDFEDNFWIQLIEFSSKEAAAK